MDVERDGCAERERGECPGGPVQGVGRENREALAERNVRLFWPSGRVRRRLGHKVRRRDMLLPSQRRGGVRISAGDCNHGRAGAHLEQRQPRGKRGKPYGMDWKKILNASYVNEEIKLTETSPRTLRDRAGVWQTSPSAPALHCKMKGVKEGSAQVRQGPLIDARSGEKW